jgi:hypothetical protein
MQSSLCERTMPGWVAVAISSAVLRLIIVFPYAPVAGAACCSGAAAGAGRAADTPRNPSARQKSSFFIPVRAVYSVFFQQVIAVNPAILRYWLEKYMFSWRLERRTSH